MRSVFAVVAFAIGVSSQAWDGARITLQETGMQEFLDILLPIINQEFANLALPDFSTSADVPVLGHITLDLTGNSISGFSIPSATLTPTPPSGIAGTITGATLKLTSNFHWDRKHWPHISDHGTFTASPQQGNIALNVQLSVDATGHVGATATTATCDFDKLSLHFSGHWDSWLYNMIIGLFSNTIKSALNKAVSTELQKAIDVTLATVLAKVRTEIYLGGGKSRCNVDIGFGDIGSNSTGIELGNRFAISNNATGAVCPTAGVPMPYAVQSGRMIQIFVSETPLNCALWVAYVNGALERLDQSNTTVTKTFLPAIYNAFPNAPLQIEVLPQALPLVKFSSASGVVASLPFALNMTAITDAPHFAASIGVDIGFGIDFTVGPAKAPQTGSALYGSVTQLTLALSVLGSGVGPIDPVALQLLVDVLLPIAQNLINGVLADGFPLPISEGITLTNPAVNIEDGYLMVAADLTLNP